MKITLLAFGQIEEIIQKGETTFFDVSDTESLKNKLASMYPKIEHIPYQVSVNKTIVNGNHKLTEGDEVALLPPFSGG